MRSFSVSSLEPTMQATASPSANDTLRLVVWKQSDGRGDVHNVLQETSGTCLKARREIKEARVMLCVIVLTFLPTLQAASNLSLH